LSTANPARPNSIRWPNGWNSSSASSAGNFRSSFSSRFVDRLGAFYILTARPSFTAQAMMFIDARKVQLLQQQSLYGDIPVDTAAVESQVELLKSENVALAVVKNLHLTEDPEFAGAGVLGFFGGLFSFAEPDETTAEFMRTRRVMRAFDERLRSNASA